MKLITLFILSLGAVFGQCGVMVWNSQLPGGGGLDCIGTAGGGGSGTVTSVGLAGTANQITVTGASPITTSGSWTLSFPAGGVTLPGTTTGTFSAAGSTTQYQYNNAGVLGGSAILSHDGTNRINTFDRAHLKFGFIPDPTVAPTVALVNAAGNIPANDYVYSYGFVSAVGQTGVSPGSLTITTDAGHGQVTVSGLPACPTGATGVNVYRSNFGVDQISLVNPSPIACGVTSYVDNLASVGQLEPWNSTAGRIDGDAWPMGYITPKFVFFGNNNNVPTEVTEDYFNVFAHFTNTGYPKGMDPAGMLARTTYAATALDGNNSYIYGFNHYATTSGTGTLGGLSGIQASTTKSHNGNLDILEGISSRATAFGTGTLTDMINVHVNGSYVSGGTVTNSYGLKIEDQAGASNNWAIQTGLGKVQFGDNTEAPRFSTTTNCSDSAGAAACGSAAAGSVVIDAGATSVVVSTTAVTANSQILASFDSSLSTRLSVTCNTTVALPVITARTAGASFTVTVPAAPAVNPACFNYTIVN